VVFKNPSYSDYIVNWMLIVSAADSGMKKEDFVSGGTKGFQVDVDKGDATAMTVGDKTIYKYVSDPTKPSPTMAALAKTVGLDPAPVRTMYAFFSGDAAVMIFAQAPPPDAPASYGGFLNIERLIIP
jgi:hypothetical protein